MSQEMQLTGHMPEPATAEHSSQDIFEFQETARQYFAIRARLGRDFLRLLPRLEIIESNPTYEQTIQWYDHTPPARAFEILATAVRSRYNAIRDAPPKQRQQAKYSLLRKVLKHGDQDLELDEPPLYTPRHHAEGRQPGKLSPYDIQSLVALPPFIEADAHSPAELVVTPGTLALKPLEPTSNQSIGPIDGPMAIELPISGHAFVEPTAVLPQPAAIAPEKSSDAVPRRRFARLIGSAATVTNVAILIGAGVGVAMSTGLRHHR